jgi:hypothetical protein
VADLLEPYEAVVAHDVPAWVIAGSTWLRDGPDCHPVRVRDAAGGGLGVELPGGCELHLDVSDGLHSGGITCGTTVSMSAHATNPAWVVVTVGPDHVGWRQPVQVAVHWPARTVVVEPCAGGGTRSCDTTPSFEVITIEYGTGGPGEGIGTVWTAELVDCTVPCDRRVQDEAAAVAARIAASAWTRRAGPELRLYRTAPACRAAQTVASRLVRPP